MYIFVCIYVDSFIGCRPTIAQLLSLMWLPDEDINYYASSIYTVQLYNSCEFDILWCSHWLVEVGEDQIESAKYTWDCIGKYD